MVSRKARLTVHAGASEHYAHADAYHARYAARDEDRDFYVRRARGISRVLEYGAGTGRLTIPMAKTGAQVTAVDVSAPMLEELTRQLNAEPSALRRRVSVHRADMRRFDTRRRHGLAVVGFHTFCHLYSFDDVSSFLRRVWRLLEPGGRLVFDLPMPHIDMDGYDPIAQVRVTQMEGPEGAEQLSQRLFQPCEIEMHLHYAGFEQVRLTADFGRRRVDQDADIIVVSARKPA